MRDAEILGLQRDLSDSVAQNAVHLMALETVLFGHRLSLLRCLMLCLINPRRVIIEINRTEKRLMKQIHSAVSKERLDPLKSQKQSLLLPKGGLVTA